MKGPSSSKAFGQGSGTTKTSGNTKKAPSILLGDLLVQTRLIRLQDLADAIPISLKTGLPIGRILIGSGAIRESTMQAVLFAQSLIRDRLLDEQLACEAIQVVDRDSCSLDDALKKLGWKSESYEMTNRLGELFLEASIITEEQLSAGLDAFFTTGLPLARVLVLQGVISESVAFTALTAQKLLRDEQVSRKQATDALWLAHNNNTSLEHSLNYHGYVGPEAINTIRIGELLLLANVINNSDLLEGVERSINNNKLIGETMVQDGKLSEALLNSALELQKMTTKGELEPSAAGEALRRINATGMTVAEAVHEVSASAALRTELLGLQPLNNFVTAKPFNERLLKGLMPAEKVAELLGISVKAVSKSIQKGALSGFKKDGKWFVNFSDVPAAAPETVSKSETISETEHETVSTLPQALNSSDGQTGSETTNAVLHLAFDPDQSAPVSEIVIATADTVSNELELEQALPLPDFDELELEHALPLPDFDELEPEQALPLSDSDELELEHALPLSDSDELELKEHFHLPGLDKPDHYVSDDGMIVFSLESEALDTELANTNNVNHESDKSENAELRPAQSQQIKAKRYKYPSLGRTKKRLKPQRKQFSTPEVETEPQAQASVQSIGPELGDLMAHHLQVLEKLSLRNENLSYRVGYLEGRLLANTEISKESDQP